MLVKFKNEAGRQNEITTNIILDFNHVTFIDSAGLGYLISLWKQVSREGKKLYMVGISPSVQRFLELTRTWDLFKESACKDLDRALKLLERKGNLPPFYYLVERGSGYIILNIFGRLDAAEISRIDLSVILGEIGTTDCIMNLRGLNFVDSTGLTFFLKIQKEIAKLGNICILSGLKEHVHQMFRITRLNHLFQILPDLTASLKMLEKK